MDILPADKSKPFDGGPSFSLGNRLYRATWNLAWILFAAWTPVPMHGWRRFLLNLFGANVPPSAKVYPSVRIWSPRNLEMGVSSCLGSRVDCYTMAPISIGARVVVSQDASLCAGSHDISDPGFQLIVRPIKIDADAWIAAGAFVGPGVHVGEGAVLGARAVAFSDLRAWSVYIGNPCVFVRERRYRSPADPQSISSA